MQIYLWCLQNLNTHQVVTLRTHSGDWIVSWAGDKVGKRGLKVSSWSGPGQDRFRSLAKLSPPFPLCAPLVWFTLLFARPVFTFLSLAETERCKKFPGCLFFFFFCFCDTVDSPSWQSVGNQPWFKLLSTYLQRFSSWSWTRHNKSVVYCMFHEGHGPPVLSWHQKTFAV